ncbi:response regulator transcription factor [Clostridium folliculivorans]|uniref:Stage 0 sporulation protein A homolog n=1 Tax=Clostridium folliculivorans TaxID=2886038 RepID=A0A9W5XYP3_9CLOT|nr:response regulator transcription factor [Clostridium folliculivorans]GKU23466.1 DNA-binding response regulator [Clostridium folliculivorans]GKU29582.1 DNA-binding response regulator [Clostridium folliculivorans]
MYSIMIIEDDKKLSTLIKNHLEKYGYKTYQVEDFSKIKTEFVSNNPNLVLMDINLPLFDGFYWCRDIRTVSNIPIIFISARDSDMDQVMAIENGGDDYITKPFSYDVLLAKIKGVIRRAYGSYAESNSSDVFEVNGLFLYIDQNIIEYKEKKVELSKKEFQLLYSLVKNKDKIVSRETLLEVLWNDIDFVDDNTLSVNMTRVRKRLEEIGIKDVIETKRGQGYRIISSW